MKRAWLLVPCLLLSCTNGLPGEPVGTYRVVMTLEKNTCGAQAVIVENGKAYSVELREDRGRGYWHVADHAPIQGTLDEKRNFVFTFSRIAASEADAGPNGCRIVQDDLLTGSLRAFSFADGGLTDGGLTDGGLTDGGLTDAGFADGGSAVESDGLTTLVAEHVMQLSGYAGADCSRALKGNGGPFDVLPCEVRYTLSGTERDPL